jgi:hypothetical protein
MQVREVRIDGCDLVFLAKSKDGDHHQEMNSVVFLEWFENQLMAVNIQHFHWIYKCSSVAEYHINSLCTELSSLLCIQSSW